VLPSAVHAGRGPWFLGAARFARVYFSVKGKQEQLQPLLDSVVDRYELRSKDDRADIRKHVGDYVRLYAFLSQVITFRSPDLAP